MAIDTVGEALRPIDQPRTKGGGAKLSDAQLLEPFLDDGDDGALDAPMGRHGPAAGSVCRRIFREPHDANDIYLVRVKTVAQFGVETTWRAGCTRSPIAWRSGSISQRPGGIPARGTSRGTSSLQRGGRSSGDSQIESDHVRRRRIAGF
jgi:hypothetical protein